MGLKPALSSPGAVSLSYGRCRYGETLPPPSLSPQLSLTSAAVILKAARELRAQGLLLGKLAVDEGPVRELILLVAEVLEACDREKPRTAGFLQEEGIEVISDLLLVSPTFSPRSMTITSGTYF